jgi:signal transduction histidine kinase
MTQTTGSRGTKGAARVLLVSVLFQAMALAFHLLERPESFERDWWQQILVLLVCSILVSILLVLSWSHGVRLALLAINILVLGFLSYPRGGHLTLELPIALALLFEMSRIQGRTEVWCLTSVTIAVIVFFDVILPGRAGMAMRALDALPVFPILVFTQLLVIAYRGAVEGRWEALETVRRLDGAVRQLTDANTSLQEYAVRASGDERWRVSRELHDPLGHALTNLRMMMELAERLTPDSLPALQDIHKRAAEQALQGLEDVRVALRFLRSVEPRALVGRQGIIRLARAFENSTGVRVRVEHGNTRDTYDEAIDGVVYRMVQEGLTNALRHGRANQVTVLLWERETELVVILQDDGVGSQTTEDGIGISGMRERVEALGGTIERGNNSEGFRLCALIPIRRQRTEGGVAVSGWPVDGPGRRA